MRIRWAIEGFILLLVILTNISFVSSLNYGYEWIVIPVDSVGDVGAWTSIALDSTGYPHISYCDYENYSLKYARKTASGWSKETVDSGSDVGTCTSIALDSTGNAHISYSDDANYDLKYAYVLPPPPPQQEFKAGTWNGKTYYINTYSDSSFITNFNFNQSLKQINFDVTGPTNTLGFSNVTIPNDLLGGPYSVFVGKSPPITLSNTSNGTHTSLYFSYGHSTQNVMIVGTTVVPEFPFAAIPLLFTILILITIMTNKRMRLRTQTTSARLK